MQTSFVLSIRHEDPSKLQHSEVSLRLNNILRSCSFTFSHIIFPLATFLPLHSSLRLHALCIQLSIFLCPPFFAIHWNLCFNPLPGLWFYSSKMVAPHFYMLLCCARLIIFLRLESIQNELFSPLPYSLLPVSHLFFIFLIFVLKSIEFDTIGVRAASNFSTSCFCQNNLSRSLQSNRLSRASIQTTLCHRR